MAFSKSLLTGEPLTRDSFRHPPRAMGILPFWFWNGELEEKELEWQLREYRSKGIPGVFIHGRFGLKVPYVSDQWFRKVAFAVRKAKEIGIETWVYDEMNWPSGTAERNVLKKYPHLTQRYLELVALKIDGPLFTFLEATDSRYVNTGDSHPVAAFGCTEEEYQNGIRNLIDLTQNLSFEKVLPWEAPPGQWRLLYLLEKEVPYYIDALDPESTRRFLEITHEQYKRAVGTEFGSVVPGFFTDEPAMLYYQVGVDNYVIPWSKQMFKIFLKRRGYDLRPHLPALYAPMGAETARIRYDFWRTLSEQYSETYYRQIRDWCDANGVIFTGHLLFEEWIRLHARCEGNLFHHLKHMHLIGVDHLYPKIGTEKEPDQHVAMKIGSSAAHHFGSTRVLCESMGGTHWDCTMERMKWIADWEYVLGVNLFNNHGYHYSIEGERKRDWPPSQFYHHPWWKHYDAFTGYMTRISHLLSGGRHVARILMLYPLSSVWTNYVPQHRTPVGNLIESEFNYFTDVLLRLHYDFDYVDEETLSSALIGNGMIKIRDEKYSVLILPPVTHIKKTSFDAMRKFVRSGGTIIADTLLPVEFLESESPEAAPDVRKLFGVSPATLLHEFEDGASPKLKILHRNTRGGVHLFRGMGLQPAGAKGELKRLLNACCSPDVTVSDEEVFYLHRIKDGYDFYFFVNTSRNEKGAVEISFERAAMPELWDPASGETTPIQVFRVNDGRLHLSLDFAAVQSHVVVMNGTIKQPHIAESTLRVEHFDGKRIVGTSRSQKRVSATVSTKAGLRRVGVNAKRPLPPLRPGGEFSFAIEDDNVLAIGKWKMKVDEGLDNRYAQNNFDDSGWLDVTNGAWETQLPEERDDPAYPVALWYRASFNAEAVPPNTRVLIDGFSGREYRLFINGEQVRDAGKRSKLDAEIKEVEIQPLVRTGRNVVAVRLVAARRTDGILDLLKIVGDFSVREVRGRHSIVERVRRIKAGNWTMQGYPFYSGTGIYRMEFKVPEKYLEGRVILEADCGEDVLEVIVNGSAPVVRPWHPYSVDVSRFLRAGMNAVEIRVTNTLINMLEAVKKPSGLLSAPLLTHQHRYTLSL